MIVVSNQPAIFRHWKRRARKNCIAADQCYNRSAKAVAMEFGMRFSCKLSRRRALSRSTAVLHHSLYDVVVTQLGMPLRPGLPRVDNRAVVCPNRRRRLSRGVMLATIESSPLMPGDGSIRWRNLNDMASSKVNRSSTSSQPQSSASRRLLGGQKHSR